MFITFLSYSQITLNQVEVVDFKTNRNDTLYGVDVSHYQGMINWEKVDTNIKFAIIKVSEGINRLDDKFLKNWENCNVIKGGYHFFRPQYSGKKQASFFLNNLPINAGDIRPVIDVEYTPYWSLKKKRKYCVNNLIEMIHYLKKETGVLPIIYTSESFWINYVYPNYKDKHDFWIVDYRNKLFQKKTKIDWVIWQYSCKGKVVGIKRLVDKNIMFTKTMSDVLIKN